jgi:uncharacterized protein with GYD domain
MVQVSYTPAAWAAMVKNPQDRSNAVKTSIEELGGKILGFWMAFGQSDIIGIVEMPDNISAASWAMAVSAGGACTDVTTTPLLDLTDGMAAMKKAGSSSYRPPK